MKLSEKGAKFIAQFEGFSPVSYRDIVGVLTIGYGTVIQPGSSLDKTRISKEEGLALLRRYCDVVSEDLVHLIKKDLTQHQIDAIISFIYNLGIGNFMKSTLLKRINDGSPDSVIVSELKRWNRAGGKVVRGLTRRRIAEGRLYSEGIYE